MDRGSRGSKYRAASPATSRTKDRSDAAKGARLAKASKGVTEKLSSRLGKIAASQARYRLGMAATGSGPTLIAASLVDALSASHSRSVNVSTKVDLGAPWRANSSAAAPRMSMFLWG